MSTEREKMAAGEWYSCMDAELDILALAGAKGRPPAQYDAAG